MIAYHILCHDNLKQVATLIDALYTDQDTFLIDIDHGQNPDMKPLSRFRFLPNVHITRDANIGWGAGGTLRKTMKGAFALLEMNRDWQYYVVLSGQDLPLKSNDTIREVFTAGHAEKTNFIRCHLAEPVSLDAIPVNNTSTQRKLWGDRGHTKIYGRVGTIDPQAHMYARRLVDVTEVADLGEVHVGTCDPLLMQRRDNFFDKYPFHVGANWFNLHRSLIEYMVEDPLTYEMYDVMRTTFIPDESFFQTYIKSSPFRDTVSQHYGRLILRPAPVGKVKVFERTDWSTIEQSPDLFGRKFDTRHDSRIVSQVLSARAG